MPNYKDLQSLINSHAPIIKKDLGIEDLTVTIDLSKEHPVTKDEGILYGRLYSNEFGKFNVITRVEGYHVIIYPDNIMDKGLFMLSNSELSNIVIETLAHELRHVYQSKHNVGKICFNYEEAIPYLHRPSEIDARKYAKEYMLSNNLTCFDNIKRIRKVASNVVAVAAGYAIGLSLRHLINLSKKK